MRDFLRKLRARVKPRPAVRSGIAVLPAIAGMALVAVGAGLVYMPAGLIVAGLLFLRADARM